jgi:acyl-coenzyme A thioesterase PaaI-like protein
MTLDNRKDGAVQVSSVGRQRRLIEFAKQAPIVKTFGMSLQYKVQGQAIWELPHNPGLDHAGGDVHGGIIATLLDNAGWFTAAPYFDTWISIQSSSALEARRVSLS